MNTIMHISGIVHVVRLLINQEISSSVGLEETLEEEEILFFSAGRLAAFRGLQAKPLARVA
jgi:hypothetical protein